MTWTREHDALIHRKVWGFPVMQLAEAMALYPSLGVSIRDRNVAPTELGCVCGKDGSPRWSRLPNYSQLDVLFCDIWLWEFGGQGEWSWSIQTKNDPSRRRYVAGFSFIGTDGKRVDVQHEDSEIWDTLAWAFYNALASDTHPDLDRGALKGKNS